MNSVLFMFNRFKSPLIQSLLNKARNTRSTDNLLQSNITTSQIINENIINESTTVAKSTNLNHLSDDERRENSRTNNTTNGHSDLQ